MTSRQVYIECYNQGCYTKCLSLKINT
uniref:Uncharacterized protein n=1 Tax=Rhizophora mucronata TaxID=61149 RepID=A0A2P2PUF6_RHIMU